MSHIKLEVIANWPSKGKIIEVEYNGVTGKFNGSNKDNWVNLLELTGLAGFRVASFKQDHHNQIYKIIQ